MPKLLLAGHSHAYALGLPAAAADAVPTVVEIANDFQGLTGPWPRNDAYWTALAEHGRDRIVLLSFLGNEHLAHFLIESHAPFDFVSSALPDAPIAEDVVLVPEAMVREMLPAHREVLPAILKQLKTAGVTVLLLGTPPPKGDTAALLALLATEPFFIARLKRAGLSLEDAPLASPLLQLKLWHVLQDLLREAAALHDVDFIPFPEEARTPDGFLLPRYWKRDVTHANPECGALFRDVIVRQVEAA